MIAFLAVAAAAGCTPMPDLLVEAEIAGIKDEVFRLAMAADLAVDNLECDEWLDSFSGSEPLFVGNAIVHRTRSDLAEFCEAMIVGRTGGFLEPERVATHVLSRDAAYIVREGTYTVEFEDRPDQHLGVVLTGVWVRKDGEWTREHLHKSWRELEEG